MIPGSEIVGTVGIVVRGRVNGATGFIYLLTEEVDGTVLKLEPAD